MSHDIPIKGDSLRTELKEDKNC